MIDQDELFKTITVAVFMVFVVLLAAPTFISMWFAPKACGHSFPGADRIIVAEIAKDCENYKPVSLSAALLRGATDVVVDRAINRYKEEK